MNIPSNSSVAVRSLLADGGSDCRSKELLSAAETMLPVFIRRVSDQLQFSLQRTGGLERLEDRNHFLRRNAESLERPYEIVDCGAVGHHDQIALVFLDCHTCFRRDRCGAVLAKRIWLR